MHYMCAPTPTPILQPSNTSSRSRHAFPHHQHIIQNAFASTLRPRRG
ncbi:hypothetical protein HaLaN_13436, partial [Haematococcus lacustris]